MSSVELNWPGIERLFTDPAGPVGEIIVEKTEKVKETAKALMDIPGSGRLYDVGEIFFVSHRGGRSRLIHFTGGSDKYSQFARTTAHQAGAPGAPAHDDPGHPGDRGLRESIHDDFVIGENPRAVTPTFNGQVGSDKRYVLPVELGHRAYGRHGETKWTAERPFLRPALHIVVPD